MRITILLLIFQRNKKCSIPLFRVEFTCELNKFCLIMLKLGLT